MKLVEFGGYRPKIDIIESDLIDCQEDLACLDKNVFDNTLLMFEITNQGLITIPESKLKI